MIFFTDLVIGETQDYPQFKDQINKAISSYKQKDIKGKNLFSYLTCLGEILIVKDENENKTILFKLEYKGKEYNQ